MATLLTEKNQEYIPQRWETVPCPFCEAQESKVFEKFGNRLQYAYEQCQSCRLVYQKRRPAYDANFVETAYEVYTTDISHHWDGKKLTEKGQLVHREFCHIVNEIESFVGKKGRLLEIGSNTGLFCKAAQDSGWNVTGVEISKSMTEIAKKCYQVPNVAADWMKLEFEKGSIDAIYASHVIEHIPDPMSWMKRFKEVLSPNGVVCLSVPNMQSIDRKYKRVLKKMGLRKEKWEPWRTPDHLYEPCEESMSRFIRAAGFEILRKYTYPSEWTGEVSPWHRLFHFQLRWGAKARYYIRPIK